MSQNVFFDTNIIIGYSLKLDPWHYFSKRLLNKFNNIYWSKTVEEEAKYKINNLLEHYERFFIDIVNNLNQEIIYKNEFLALVKEIKYIANKKVPFNQLKLAEILWEDGGWYEYVSSNILSSFIYDKIEELYSDVAKSFNKIQFLLKLHIRYKQYLILLDNLKNLSISGINHSIHSPDDYILLDAHDLALKINEDIIFISSDIKLLDFKEKIVEITKITSMYFIEDAFYIK